MAWRSAERASGSPMRLFDAPVQPWYVNDTDRWQVAPDGQRFLLLVSEGESAAPPIDIVVNWTTQAQALLTSNTPR